MNNLTFRAFDLQQIMEEDCGHETEENEHDNDGNHDAKREAFSPVRLLKP